MAALEGRVAVVTGASSGIGAACARALAADGAHVALGARRLPALEEVRAGLDTGRGQRSVSVATDVTRREDVQALVTGAEEELGPVDVLVHCAGVMFWTLMANVRHDEWRRTVDVNCQGLLHAVEAVLPGLLARGRGHLVLVSSDAGRKVFPGLAVYSATKFFTEALAQGLRLETVGSGVRVTTVQPGNVATALHGLSTDREAVARYGEPTGAELLQPDDVAASVLHALRQPAHVAVNEILVEPRDEPV